MVCCCCYSDTTRVEREMCARTSVPTNSFVLWQVRRENGVYGNTGFGNQWGGEREESNLTPDRTGCGKCMMKMWRTFAGFDKDTLGISLDFTGFCCCMHRIFQDLAWIWQDVAYRSIYFLSAFLGFTAGLSKLVKPIRKRQTRSLYPN